MDPEAVVKVRRFARLVTQRVGALDDHFLSRDRPLGEARVLWEVGDGSDVRALRERLDLDSGYLSRLLRSLEADGLVEVEAAEHDRRVRVARLTTSGRRERDVLDRRSDELAEALVQPLGESQRERLVSAMGEVERLLTAAMVRIAPIDPEHPDARWCLDGYAADMDTRFSHGFDPELSLRVEPAEVRPPAGVMVVASLMSEPVGCGSLKFHRNEPTEIKRLWVAAHVRGLGVGRRLMEELERRAAERHPVARLDTNESLTEAIAMYRSSGWVEVPPFNEEPYAHHWFEKRVG